MSSIAQSVLMALTVRVNQFASSNVHAVNRREARTHTSATNTRSSAINVDVGRRGLVLFALAAAPQVPESRTQLLEKYLKKSEENKAKNDKERMDSYNKRIYKDYFEFSEGVLENKRGPLTDSEKSILEWQRNNR